MRGPDVKSRALQATALILSLAACGGEQKAQELTTTLAPSTSAASDTASPWDGCPTDEPIPIGAERVGSLDLDGDSSAETVLWVERSGALTNVVAGVSDRVVSSVPVGNDVFSPSLLAVVDLDGDGVREVFLGGVGNTARSAIVLTPDSCVLRPLRSATEDPFLLLVGVGGNSCASTGCAVANRCERTDDGLDLSHVLMQPVGGGPDTTVVDPPVSLTTTTYRMQNGEIVELATTTQEFSSISDLPGDAPSMSAGETVQC